MSIENPLGLENLLVNTVAGNYEIFVALFVIFLAAVAGKFQMPKSIFITMLALFGIMFAQLIDGLYLIVLLLIVFGVYSGVSRLVES